MKFGVLGPLEISDRGQTLAVGPPRVRQVCAILLIRPGHLVSLEEFVDELWPDGPPADSRALVRGYLSRLRRALRTGLSGPGAAKRLVTRKPGYLLHVADAETDLHRFAEQVAEARAAARAKQPGQAVDRYRQAQRLWRGVPYADVPRTPGIATAALALTEQRLITVEEQFDAELAAGNHTDVVTELTAHVAAHPLRERAAGQLMLALYRSGRQADALGQFRRTRRLLTEEIGADPGPELQALHQRILAGAPMAGAPEGVTVGEPVPVVSRADPEHAPVPRQLAARPAPFVGRAPELARLTEMLAPRGAVAVALIVGPGGVGKTWLALRWAHDHIDRFPDGHLYIDLQGCSPTGGPVAPDAALRTFLAALGVRPAGIPADLATQTGLYRSLLAGRRMLILLDNARDADQVRPLLPGSDGCAVVVTSRRQLTGLVAADGAQPLALDLLTAADARQLLEDRLGAARLAAEPAAADDIVTRCERLPLAIALAAARAATRPGLPLAALADELRDVRGRLDALAGDGPTTDLRAVFAVSYRALTTAAATLFRLMGLHPGSDLTGSAAASLAGVPVHEIRRLIRELTDAHLLAEHVPDRFACHDLLRAYASELAIEEEPPERRNAAAGRLLDHYLHSAHAAKILIGRLDRPPLEAQPGLGVTPDRFADDGAVLDWFAREHRVLVALVRSASADLDPRTGDLADAVGAFLRRSGFWHDWRAIAIAALNAARGRHDQCAQARAHCWLAEVYACSGRPDRTASHLDAAWQLYGSLDDTVGLAYVHLCRGWIHEPRRHYQDALDDSRRALDLYRTAGHERGQAHALNNIGWYHAQLGDYERSITYSELALRRLRQLGDRAWEGRAWCNLGFAHHRLDRYERSAACYGNALDLFRNIGDHYFEARVLDRLADTHYAMADAAAGNRARAAARKILRKLGHPDTEAGTDTYGLYPGVRQVTVH
ncbi:BTAD domain-containing putative transcriptional regulator [Micromonospora sp. RP3T]|uniref:AfsR/SARP family transcriptional regulator n=1 Tax=Micromonospora sp. RP3T TaxID=2135446 RepID=UPI001304C0F3|nr:BTAD domain-containing putative transcriptional regulator [Micromonospora sp. RP3T]